MKSIYRLILRTKLNFETKEKEKKAFEPFFKLESSLNLISFFVYLISFKRRIKKGNVSFIKLL